MTPAPAKSSDLGVRTLSAIVMVSAAGVALWLGGWVFTAFVAAVGAGVIWEWWGLARRIARTPLGAALWLAAGVSYVGVAMAMLIWFRQHGMSEALAPVVLVIAVDTCAYFAGRTIGGPKIAPRISPSKTWAGLGGGAVGAMLAFVASMPLTYHDFDWSLLPRMAPWIVMIGGVTAIVAQAGDFFESWMKRRAGVKDSSNLIPGHGGLFDRVDGLLAVLFVLGLASMHSFWSAA